VSCERKSQIRKVYQVISSWISPSKSRDSPTTGMRGGRSGVLLQQSVVGQEGHVKVEERRM